MDHDCVAFHQLRLINFNRFSDQICRTCNEIKKYSDHKEKHSNLGIERKLMTNCSVGKRCKCGKNTSQVFLQKKLKSPLTIINRPSKRLSFGTSKNPICTNIIQKPRRPCDVEQKFSLYGVFSDKIKPKLYNLLKSKKCLKRKQCNVIQGCKGKDIEVLFDAERFKSQKRLRKRNVVGDYRRFDMLCNSKSSRDSNELPYNNFAQSNNKMNTYRHDCTETETDIQKIYTNHSSKTCVCSKPVHYNLVEFLSRKKCKCVHLNNIMGRNCNSSAAKEIQRSRINREVSVTPSCFCKNGAGDSATNRHSLDSEIQTECPKKHTGNGDAVLFECPQRKPTYSLFSDYFSNDHLVAIIKSVTKILLLSFAIVAWSPCIISVYIYWLITYPLRPHHIFTQSKFDECNKCKSCFQCGNALWYFIFHSIVRALEKFVHVFNILVSSIKNQKHEHTNRKCPCMPQTTVVNRCLRHKHKKLHINTNPKEKYTLCYMRRKGWIIKPSRQHRNRKQKLPKYYAKDINIDKCICDTMKSKKYPGVFRINTPGTLTTFKTSPCIQISKKRHKENEPKINCRTYLSKMGPIKSAPVVMKTSTLRNEKPIPKFTLTQSLPECNIPALFKRGGKLCTSNFRRKPLLVSKYDIENNKWNRNIDKRRYSRDVLYNTQIYSPFTKHLYRQKHQIHLSNKYQCMRCSFLKRKTGINSQSKQCPYCPKISFVTPSKRRKRTKYVLISKDSFRKFKDHSKRVNTRKNIFQCFKTTLKKFKRVVNSTDTEFWQSSDVCKDICVSNLRKKPWFWVYKRCPSFYPYFLVFLRFNENCVQCFLLMVSSCIWFPIICCCYLCCSLISECM